MDLFAVLSFIELGLWFLFYNLPPPPPHTPTHPTLTSQQSKAEQPTRRESPAHASSVPPAPMHVYIHSCTQTLRQAARMREGVSASPCRPASRHIFPERLSESCGPMKLCATPPQIRKQKPDGICSGSSVCPFLTPG